MFEICRTCTFTQNIARLLSFFSKIIFKALLQLNYRRIYVHFLRMYQVRVVIFIRAFMHPLIGASLLFTVTLCFRKTGSDSMLS